jgi:hypothetical protein
MGKKYCDLKMNYISETGPLARNNSYFNFVELENFACWIAAEVNIEEDKEIAMLMGDKILKDFKRKPTVSKREINQSIRDAYELVTNLSRNIELKISLAIAVTDYAKMLCMVTGNERLYRFKSGVQPKTDAEAILELDAAESDQNIRFYEDCAYSGHPSFLGPFSVKTIRLNDGDVILLGHNELWNTLGRDAIYHALYGVKEPLLFLNQLKNSLLPKQEESIINHLFAAIFIYHLFQVRRGGYRKIVLAGITVLLLAVAFLVFKPIVKPVDHPNVHGPAYRSVFHPNVHAFAKLRHKTVTEKRKSVFHPKLPVREVPPQTRPDLKKFVIYEQNGDRLVQDEAYVRALDKYNQAMGLVKSKDYAVQARIDKKIGITKMIIAADRLATTENLNKALAQYKAAQKEAREDQTYGQSGLQKRVATVLTKLTVQELVAKGDRKVAQKNFSKALDEYTRAQTLAVKAACDTAGFGLESKIKKVAGILMDDLALQKLTKLKTERERQERERLAKESQEQEKQAKERQEQERLTKESQEQEKQAKERQEQERLTKERPEQEKQVKERQEQEQLEKEK